MLPHAGTGKVLVALMYNKAPYDIHAVEYVHVAISHFLTYSIYQQ